jgi:hypothetical protein
MDFAAVRESGSGDFVAKVVDGLREQETFDHYDRRPSLFRQYKHISTQDYRDGRKDNSRCKLRDLFYFWCGLLLAWRRCRRRLLGRLRR